MAPATPAAGEAWCSVQQPGAARRQLLVFSAAAELARAIQ